MDITRAAIEKNRVTIVAMLLVFAAGIGTYLDMPRAEDPGFTVRTALVVTRFPGASPRRVENLVTDKLEKAIQEMPEIDFITSQSKGGVSIINVNIRAEYDDMQPIWDSLRRKVESASGDLPEGVIGPFVNDEFGDVFGVVVTISGDGFDVVELKVIADEVRDELLLIPEAAKVAIAGAQDERIFVEYNNAKLAEVGLSPAQLKNILEARNIVIPGGSVSTGDERIALEPSGSFETIDDVRQTLISVPGASELVALQDIANVSRGTVDPPRTMLRANGEQAVAVSISMREGGNILDLGTAVKATLARLEATYPIGVTFDVIQFQPDAVDRKIRDFVGNLIQAVLIVIAVMLFSLGIRTGLVVASLIPSAIVAALLVMGFFGIGLDQMSLASLIIALGMLVDNAIVMSESILVQMKEGKPALEAARDSAAELKIPLLTSSLTTAAAFLPIFLAESNVGEYTGPLFKVVTITLLCSWVISLTIVPLLCVAFLEVDHGEEQSFDTPFYRRYRGTLLTLLRHPWATVGAVAVIFFGVMRLLAFVPVIFFPPNDRPTMTVELQLPAGTPIERTASTVGRLEEFIRSELAVAPGSGEEGVVNWAAFIGEGAPRFILTYTPEPASPDYAILILNATSREIIDELVPKIDKFVFENLPEVRATAAPLQLGPPVTNPIEIRVSGRDEDQLFDRVASIKQRLREMPGPRRISDDWGARSKKLEVVIDQDRAKRAGVTNQDIAVSLQTVLSGFVTTQFREDENVIPVVLRSVAADRNDISKLEGLNVFSQLTGSSVPLKQVADVRLAWEPATIFRRDRLKTVTVLSGLAPGITAAEVTTEIAPWLEEQSRSWGIGTSWAFGGELEASSESNQSIAEKLPIAALIIIVLLVGQFNSIRRPLIILITIPLGMIGVVLGLLVMRSYFGFMTFLGVISLAGVVINNAIVLLDRIRIEIDENGLSPQRAVVESAQRRLRPIVLTTMTTLGGLIPLYLGGGPMWEPMAIAIMWGLLFATALTLGIVPVLYSLFFRVDYAGFRWNGSEDSSD